MGGLMEGVPTFAQKCHTMEETLWRIEYWEFGERVTLEYRDEHSVHAFIQNNIAPDGFGYFYVRNRWPQDVVRELRRRYPICSVIHTYPGLKIDVIGG